jgi:hypothetical protein
MGREHESSILPHLLDDSELMQLSQDSEVMLEVI